MATFTDFYFQGTRWAKERFEREQDIIIRDTTADGIKDWVEPELRTPVAEAQQADVEDMEDVQEDEGREMENDDEADNDMYEDSDEEMQSVGLELNERLRAAVAQREAGNAATVMDEEWEQWLKDAVEAGGIPFLSSELSPNANILGTRPATDGAPAMHPRLLNAARLGQWQQIPDFLHNMVRQNVEAHNRRIQASTPLETTHASSAATSLLSTRARTTPSDAASRRLDRGLINRLDDHFADQFSRRPVPPLPSSSASPARISSLRSARTP